MDDLKEIPGYEGYYFADRNGNIYSTPNKRYVKHKTLLKRKVQSDGRGYLQLTMCKDGKHKTERVHTLIAKTFIPNPNNYKEVNHIDEDKTNNAVSNLEWCTRKYNINYGNRTLKTQKPIAQFNSNRELIKTYGGIREAARDLGVLPSNISRAVKTGIKANGFYWKEA